MNKPHAGSAYWMVRAEEAEKERAQLRARIAALEAQLGEKDESISFWKADALQLKAAQERIAALEAEKREYSNEIQAARRAHTQAEAEKAQAVLAAYEECEKICESVMAEWREVGAVYFDAAKYLRDAIRARKGAAK